LRFKIKLRFGRADLEHHAAEKIYHRRERKAERYDAEDAPAS